MSEWNKQIANALMGYANDDPSTGDVRNSLMDVVTNRATLLPTADYADGSTRWAWPKVLYDPPAAWAAMLGGDTSPANAMTVAGAAMAGSLPFGRSYAGPQYAGKTLRGYHGAAGHEFGSRHDKPLFASSAADVANSYATYNGAGNAHVVPTSQVFANPRVVQANGQNFWDIPWRHGVTSTDRLAAEAQREGFDGLIVKNVKDDHHTHKGSPISDVYVSLRPGTAYSRITGDRIY